jgi:hypothetical protein
MAKLTSIDWLLDDDTLSERLRDIAIDARDLASAPEGWSSLASLFELDDEVRNGGFAQYFFNPSCVGALDAWLLARTVSPLAARLLADAARRLGESAGRPIDFEARLAAAGPGGLMPELEALVRIQQASQAASSNVKEAFARLRDACAKPRNGLQGFQALEARFFEEVDIDAAAVAYVRGNPSKFVW